MSIDAAIDELLGDLKSMKELNFDNYWMQSSFNQYVKYQDLKDSLIRNGLVHARINSPWIDLSDTGAQIAQSGGWLKHLERLRADESRRREIELKGAIGSHRSGVYAKWGFWLSIVGIIWSAINSIYPGFLAKWLPMLPTYINSLLPN